jgi:peptidylprolyl isomerase
MEKVENNMYISVHYKGTLGNGEVFDSSDGREPLEVKMGEGQLIRGFENALMGMSLNEKKSFTIVAQDAYGEKDEKLMYNFPRADIPAGADPQVGQMIGLQTPDGRHVPAQVVSVDDEKVVLDMNHPLAGEALTFDIEVVGISDKPTQAQAGCGCGCGNDSSPDDGCATGGGCSSGCCG